MKRFTFAAYLLLAVQFAMPSVRGQALEIPPLEPSPAMATRLRWLQFTMVSGRIVASSSDVTNITVPLSTTLEGRRRERLALNINYSLTNVQYDLKTPAEQLALALTNSSQVQIHRARTDGKYDMKFEQTPGQPLLLAIDEAGSKRSWRAESFWHLYLAEAEVVRRHLIPVLELLHPLWQLNALGTSIEDLLFRRVQSQPQPDRQQWSKLVQDLASPKFAERKNAQRELYKAGQVVVPYLQNLDRTTLDAEQAYRVRSLVEALAIGYEDTADRIVIWLSGDEQVWLALLSHADPTKRRVAAEQLTAVLGGPIQFEPDAADATRAGQIERLRARLQKPSVEKPSKDADASIGMSGETAKPRP